ncbi:MAG: stalk domain-containing protein [Bacillota bacterium]
MRKRKTAYLVLILTVVLLFGQKLLAAQAADIAVLVDGERLSCDVPPVIEQGRTLVPLRAIFEALGATVDWDGTTRTVTGRKGTTTVKLVVGQKTAYVNGEAVTLDVPARIISGRTMVPLRFVGESLGARVEWDGTAPRVIVGKEVVPGTDGSRRITVAEYFVTPKGEIEKRAVRVPCPPRRVVVTGSYQAEILRALGQEKKVIGVYDYTKKNQKWLGYVEKVPSVGSAVTPDVEKIISLKPDLVLEWAMKPEIKSQLERAGIPVMRVYGYNHNFLGNEIRTLGLIFQCPQRAEAYADFIEKHWRLISERTRKLRPNQRVRVYWENSIRDWGSTGPGSGGHTMIEWAGGANITAPLGLANPTVTPEWVAGKDPQVVVKNVSADFGGVTSKGIGFEAETIDELVSLQGRIMVRPALRTTTAVKRKGVYLISSSIAFGPQSAVGLCYIAKWLHPELFRDVNPEAVHREMLKKFYGEELRGVWVYPPLK